MNLKLNLIPIDLTYYRSPSCGLVGVPGFEPGTSSLSGTRSNQLSYTPSKFKPIRRFPSKSTSTKGFIYSYSNNTV